MLYTKISLPKVIILMNQIEWFFLDWSLNKHKFENELSSTKSLRSNNKILDKSKIIKILWEIKRLTPKLFFWFTSSKKYVLSNDNIFYLKFFNWFNAENIY